MEIESIAQQPSSSSPIGLPISRRALLRGSAAVAGLLVGGGLLEACGSSSSPQTTSSTGSANAPRRGGNLVGIGGGTSADSIEADFAVTNVDDLRLLALYNGLVTLSDDGKQMENELAEEFTPSPDGVIWTIRLRPDVTFHNGKTLGAEDLIYTFKRILNPKRPGPGAASLAPIRDMKILDPLTVRVTMSFPYLFQLPEQLWPSFNYGIVPVGYNPKSPVGTGPFKYRSFTPGQQSIFVRNSHYWKSGQPYLDQLTIIDFSDDNATYNALLSNQIDVYGCTDAQLVTEARNWAV